MRLCPECEKPMVLTKKAFAAIDVCPECGGTFLDAGEGAATFGPDAEMRFLVDDGRARKLSHTRRRCPAGHPPMTVFGVRASNDRTVEIDLCTECGGFFLDAGEGEALAAVDAAPPGTFAPPPRMSNQDMAIFDQRREQPSFFARFVLDFVSGERPPGKRD